ncbi:hypothetical protein KEM48_009811 [Puccinia striiformis f. sp. tritici PST-130]|nr:hypothetical protein KEM48_009811 [Puccinia striiformis f. sp. tritici PST-130]
MFEQNGISPSDAHQLVTLWASAGLHGVSGLQCRQCTVNSKKRGGRKAHPIKDIDAKLDEVSIISPPDFLRFKDLGPKDDAPYAEADPPAEAKSDVVKESLNCLQPPLEMRIRRPPTTVANIHPPVSVPPPTRSNPLNAEVEPADLPALEAKRGHPKKRPEIKTTVSFKPDLESVLDSNADRIQARHKATWHSHLPPPTPPPSQSVELKHGGASTEDKSKTKEEATLAPKKVATSGPKKAAPLGTKKAATAPKKKATTAVKKKGSTSAPKTPATLASTAPTTFEPAPLTDTDYDWMAARGAAYWAEHWAKEDFKKATPEPSQITVAKEIAARRSARTRRSDA